MYLGYPAFDFDSFSTYLLAFWYILLSVKLFLCLYRNNTKIQHSVGGVEGKTMQMLSNITAVVKPLGAPPLPCMISVDVDYMRTSPDCKCHCLYLLLYHLCAALVPLCPSHPLLHGFSNHHCQLIIGLASWIGFMLGVRAACLTTALCKASFWGHRTWYSTSSTKALSTTTSRLAFRPPRPYICTLLDVSKTLSFWYISYTNRSVSVMDNKLGMFMPCRHGLHFDMSGKPTFFNIPLQARLFSYISYPLSPEFVASKFLDCFVRFVLSFYHLFAETNQKRSRIF